VIIFLCFSVVLSSLAIARDWALVLLKLIDRYIEHVSAVNWKKKKQHCDCEHMHG